jgi:hypothetical protein
MGRTGNKPAKRQLEKKNKAPKKKQKNIPAVIPATAPVCETVNTPASQTIPNSSASKTVSKTLVIDDDDDDYEEKDKAPPSKAVRAHVSETVLVPSASDQDDDDYDDEVRSAKEQKKSKVKKSNTNSKLSKGSELTKSKKKKEKSKADDETKFEIITVWYRLPKDKSDSPKIYRVKLSEIYGYGISVKKDEVALNSNLENSN